MAASKKVTQPPAVRASLLLHHLRLISACTSSAVTVALSIQQADTMANCCAVVMALLLPPVGVAMVVGCGKQVLINLLLCLLGWIPGMIHVRVCRHIYNALRARPFTSDTHSMSMHCRRLSSLCARHQRKVHSSKWPWHLARRQVHSSPSIRPPPTRPTRQHPHQAHSTPRSRVLPHIPLPVGPSIPLALHQAHRMARLQPARRQLEHTPRLRAILPHARLMTCSCRAAVPQTHFIWVGAVSVSGMRLM